MDLFFLHRGRSTQHGEEEKKGKNEGRNFSKGNFLLEKKKANSPSAKSVPERETRYTEFDRGGGLPFSERTPLQLRKEKKGGELRWGCGKKVHIIIS